MEDAEDDTFSGDVAEDVQKYRSAQKLISGLFWPLVTAVYLLISFLTNAWHVTWIVWPVAACIDSALKAFLRYRYLR